MTSEPHDAYYVVAVADDGTVVAGRCLTPLELSNLRTACIAYRGDDPASKAAAARDALALVMAPRPAPSL